MSQNKNFDLGFLGRIVFCFGAFALFLFIQKPLESEVPKPRPNRAPSSIEISPVEVSESAKLEEGVLYTTTANQLRFEQALENVRARRTATSN